MRDFALVAEPCSVAAMQSHAVAAGSNALWRDDEVVVDKDGIPHYSGARPELMKEYRKRVLFAFHSIDGEGDTQEKEDRDRLKKQKAFARKLINGLHGEAWRCCSELITDMDRLAEKEGYKHILSALQSIEKVNVVKKTEQFDRFFERGYRKKGQALDAYVRSRRQDWNDLKELDEHTSMSEDLLAYFILKQCNLSKDERRQILLNNQSKYDLEGIERAMRVSFYDIHEREKTRASWNDRPKGSGKNRRSSYSHVADDGEALEVGSVEDEETIDYDQSYIAEYDEEEEAFEAEEIPSDYGASGDDEVYEAYAVMDKQRRTYQDSRKKLKEVQKSRGFFKGDLSPEERQKVIEKEKERSRCSACNRIGHWAGDAACPKNSRSGPKKFKGSGKGKGGKKKGSGRAYLASESPLFFSLGDGEEDDGQAYMVTEELEGYGDGGRKRAARSSASDAGSLASSTPWVKVNDMPDPTSPKSDQSGGGHSEVRKQMPILVEDAKLKVIRVLDRQAIRPDLESMSLRGLQVEADRWEVKVGGNKGEILRRLQALFDGRPVARRGCVKQFIVLKSDYEIERDEFLGKEEEAEKARELEELKREEKKAEIQARLKQKELDEEKAWKSSVAKQKDSQSDDCRFFRSSRSRAVVDDLEHSGAIRKSSEGASVSKKAPSAPSKTSEPSSYVPKNDGEVLPGVRCPACGANMVLRTNSYNGKRFFGCSMFGKTNCRKTLEIEVGLAASRRAAEE